MKRKIYTIALLLTVATATQAQSPLKETREEVADVMLFGDNLLLTTRKESGGQYIYIEKRGEQGKAQKDPVLNAGLINTVIGSNPATAELFVYQKTGRQDEKIAIYQWKDRKFEKVAERPLPKMRNHSYNLGLFLTSDKNTLLVSAELGKTRGYDDIYLSKWENERWTELKNLGRKVNTRQEEFAPYVAGDSLYFSRQEAEQTYIYSVPFPNREAIGTPLRLSRHINSGAYNAYYKKVTKGQLWISTNKEKYGAYLLEQPVAPIPQEEADRAPVVEAYQVPAPVTKKKAATPGVVLFYAFNSIQVSMQAAADLDRFLSAQAPGTALVVKSYSDGYGTSEARDYVSRNRALQVQAYMEKHFAAKNFSIVLENEVVEEKGKVHRKTELYLLQ